MTTVAALIALVRALIPELSAIEWTDARLLVHLNHEYRDWAADLGQIPGPGWFTIEATFAISANGTTYTLTGLLNSTTVGNFAAVKSLYYLPTTGDGILVLPAKKGQEERHRLGAGQVAYGESAPSARWLSRPLGVPTLNVHPECSVARNYRAYVRYEPFTLGLSDSVQTDPRHDDVLVMGTALRALLEVSETDPVIQKRYEDRRMKYLEAERNADGEFESETTKVGEDGSTALFED